MEVSRGAQKLNRRIDSWSKGMRFEGQQPNDIAKDLLKGFIDLQGSLVMLSKLQEASQYTSHLNKKNNSVSKSQDQDKLTFAKARKHEFGSNITQYSISRHPSTATITITKRSSPNVEWKTNHLKKENTAKEPKVAKSVTKNVVGDESEKRIITDDKIDASPIKAGLADENPQEEETDAYVSHSGGMAFLNCK